MEQLYDARVGTAVVGVVLIIIRYEMGAYAQYVLFVARLFGECAGKEFVDAIAYKVVVCLGRVGRIATLGQCLVGSIGQVGYGVE